MSHHLVPETALTALERSARSLQDAVAATEPGRRYAAAHVAALQATAAVLAARARPATPRARRQRNAWVLLSTVAPEFEEWASFFAAGAAKRAAAEAGSRHAVTEREADDLVREADHFLALVERSLGLAQGSVVVTTVPSALPATRPAGRVGRAG
ncbi:SAV_6107 family HEPN domain-containing protein [Nocardioides massiliensis]|uniref:SAV-6107-like HEPN domain-containing protein n=1 Tax=Nocardioides massiliensis TaxID=1325935 RepID=A0ABT9NSY3_9ACTN|nr:SAV_6107 family HEPN domain-containing protein [Nocardioides massiliensis]MDP9823524.1 hypothetical protein [Nocardioides massiliensis]